METVLELLWFFGAGGAAAGAVLGWNLRRRDRRWITAFWWGVLAGLVAGFVLSVVIVHDVQTSTSSTAALGMLLVPIPPLTNAIGGAVGAALAHGLRRRRVGEPPAPRPRTHP